MLTAQSFKNLRNFLETYLISWRLLTSFKSTLILIFVLAGVMECCALLQSSVFAIFVHLESQSPTFNQWVLLFAGLIVFEMIAFRIDAARDWQIIINGHNTIWRYLHCEALRKFLEMDIPWHHKNSSGTLIGKVQIGVEKILKIYEQMSWEFVPAFLQLIVSLGPILWLAPPVALIVVGALVIFLWFTYKSFIWRQPSRIRRYDIRDEINQLSVDFVQSVETSKIFGQCDYVYNQYRAKHDEVFALGETEFRVQLNFYHAWRVHLLMVSKAAVYAILLWQIHHPLVIGGWQFNPIGIPGAFFIYTLVERLFSTFWRFHRLFEETAEASEGAKRLGRLFEETPYVVTRGDYIPKPGEPIDIHLQDICFDYQGEYREDGGHIHKMNVEFPARSAVALVGPSGAGKTTVHKLVTGLIEASHGSLILAGRPIQEWSPIGIGQIFAYVPQGDSVYIFNDTVGYNIAFGRPDATAGDIIRAAKLAGIHEFIMEKCEQGYDTIVGDRGQRLSGGQKQRLALARAILADRPVLFLDEATNSLDAITEHEIIEKMQTILAGKTVIINAHRLSTIWGIADKIVVLQDGRKVEEGTHDELLDQGGLYADLVKLQVA